VNASATGRLYEHGWQDFHRKPLGAIDVVQDVNTVERYLEGLAESLRSWGTNGPAALRAQAITGRTFALRAKAAPRGLRAGTRACSCDLLNTPADQVYAGREFALAPYGDLWVKAVTDTNTQVLRHDGQLAQTYYSSSHGGGRSEANEDSWAYGNTPVPYLRSVPDPYSIEETSNPLRTWTSRATHANFAAHVSSGRPAPLARVERVEILNRTQGGTPREVRITGVTANGATDTFVFTHRTNDSATLREKQVAGASFRVNLPASGPSAAGVRLPSSQVQRIGFGPFTDDDGNTHEYAITWAALAGVASGTSATTFEPGRNVTRAQMASFIFNTFQIPEPTVRGQFSDVPADNVHALAIDALAESGVASGVGGTRFAPSDPVTRDQMATFIARAAGLSTDAPAEAPFADVPAGATHAGAIASVAEAGITAGCAGGENRYCPRDPVSRQQMASFLRRTATS
jgi:SpoIID/LytB domain protein